MRSFYLKEMSSTLSDFYAISKTFKTLVTHCISGNHEITWNGKCHPSSNHIAPSWMVLTSYRKSPLVSSWFVLHLALIFPILEDRNMHFFLDFLLKFYLDRSKCGGPQDCNLQKFLTHASPHSASINSSKLPLMVPPIYGYGSFCSKQASLIFYSLDSTIWMFVLNLFSHVSKKRTTLIFSLFSFFIFVSMRVMTSNLFTSCSWNLKLALNFYHSD